MTVLLMSSKNECAWHPAFKLYDRLETVNSSYKIIGYMFNGVNYTIKKLYRYRKISKPLIFCIFHTVLWEVGGYHWCLGTAVLPQSIQAAFLTAGWHTCPCHTYEAND